MSRKSEMIVVDQFVDKSGQKSVVFIYVFTLYLLAMKLKYDKMVKSYHIIDDNALKVRQNIA